MNIPVKRKQLTQLAPWLAGASLALTHIAMSTNCSVTNEGRCNTCGSCGIALVGLVVWAFIKKSDSNLTDVKSEKAS